MFTAFSFVQGRPAQNEDSGIDLNGNAIRKRKQHTKSKLGCVHCKMRKIKCDQSRPGCSNCSTRNLQCRYHCASLQEFPQTRAAAEQRTTSFSKKNHRENNRNSLAKANTPYSMTINAKTFQLSLIDIPTSSANMFLLHHFDAFTCNSMLFGSVLWKVKVLSLAFENKSLMHGILLIACAHLRHLHAESELYSKAEAQHLALTIAGLRVALAGGITSENADIITSSSLILLQYTWSLAYSCTNPAYMQRSMNIGSDNMLAFSAGLKSVIQSAWHVRHGSIFQNIIHPDMLNNFKSWASNYSVPSRLEEFFLRKSTLTWPEFGNEETACSGLDCDLQDAVDRLIPILRAVDSDRNGVEKPNILVEIWHYLLLWPGKCDGTFRKAVQKNDQEALLIMLCFYLCTMSLASREFWWIRDRSKYMSQAISKHLFKDQSVCKERTRLICDYFEVNNYIF